VSDTTATERKPRAPKASGTKAYVVESGGKSWLLELDSVRVAGLAELNAALKGDLPRAKLEAA